MFSNIVYVSSVDENQHMDLHHLFIIQRSPFSTLKDCKPCWPQRLYALLDTKFVSIVGYEDCKPYVAIYFVL